MNTILKNRYMLLAIIILVVSFFVIFQTNSQNLPNDYQVQKLFGSAAEKEFVRYDVINGTPYVRFREEKMNRECRVSLIKDYKFGFFTGNWIFGQDWSCSN